MELKSKNLFSCAAPTRLVHIASRALLAMVAVMSLTTRVQFARANQAAETVIYVPSQVSSLQTAINQVPEGGVIELAAGTYYSPSGGFQIGNLYKGFTIRAAPGAQVALDGGGNREILRFVNSSLSTGGPVTFRGLKFANGHTHTAGIAAGVTLYYAEGTFIQCVFQNNSAGASANSGGIFLGYQSRALFVESVWEGNSAVHTGGGLRLDGSTAYIHDSRFINNRTNLPNHSQTSSGGAISVLNSILRVSDTRFENNQAGYVAGAIYELGSWSNPPYTPQADVIVVNSTFIDNQAQRDPSVSYSAPTEGGALHAEAQSTLRIYHSRFITNRAMSGGAITIYQASMFIESSTFQGNQATGTGSTGGYGGAMSLSSNDVASDGSINRPSASLTVQNSLIQGHYAGVTTVAQGGGGIYISGDLNRSFGWNGVPQMGTPAENRAILEVDNVIFYDLDVTKTNEGGMGGSILADLVDLTIQDSLIANCDASGGSHSSGGGLAAINPSLVNLSDSLLARNSSSGYGGGIFIQGGTINITDTRLIENAVVGTNYGSAIFSAPLDATYGGFPVGGVVQNCTISNNTGLPIFDDDLTWGPINDVRYNNNNFYHSGSMDAIVYSDSIPSYGSKKVSELNTLVVNRANSNSTPKSQSPNTALASIPVIGGLFAAPGEILAKTASGDAQQSSPAVLGYAWSGASASLDGYNVTGGAGLQVTYQPGTHTLVVGGAPFSGQVAQATQPAATFVSGFDSGNTILDWSVSTSSLLDAVIDQGVIIPIALSGSIQVPGNQERTYNFYAVTQEWGIVRSTKAGEPVLSAQSSVYVLASYPPFDHGGFFICNIGGNVFDWIAQTSTPEIITLETTSGETQTSSSLTFVINTGELSPGSYTAYVQIDAGEAGTQTVTVTIDFVASLIPLYFPFSSR
jgi:hypothetical protein